jgi:signal transduction histidine kinase
MGTRARAKDMTTLLAERDTERSWISAQLYDDIAQTLSGILATLASADSAASEADRLKKPAEIRQCLANVIDKLEQLARALHPPALRDLGLAAARTRYPRRSRSASIASRSTRSISTRPTRATRAACRHNPATAST